MCPVIEDYVVIILLSEGNMFINIEQSVDMNFETDLFTNLTV